MGLEQTKMKGLHILLTCLKRFRRSISSSATMLRDLGKAKGLKRSFSFKNPLVIWILFYDMLGESILKKASTSSRIHWEIFQRYFSLLSIFARRFLPEQ